MSSREHSTEEIQANQEFSVSCSPPRGATAYTSRTSMGAPEHSENGTKTQQLDHE